ncbi:MAG: hypothetical protein QOH11_2153 [Solirubrobacteraceae bacterium]|jgi:hypothetical protein|nr:hypothetical protein [Solirubrobacteraceae bacterium]
MLITLIIILVLLALIGGIAVHPLLFLVLLLALLLFVMNGRGRAVP